MSFASHFRHAQPDPSFTEPRKQDSRIPTRNAIENSQNSKISQNGPKMSRRISRSNLPIPESGIKGIARAAPPSTLVQKASESSRRLSNVPTASILAPATAYHNDILSPPPVMRTPSLVSGGSSVSTFDSPRSHGLRRKHSGAIDRYAAQKRADSATMDLDRRNMGSGQGFYGDYDDTVLGISPMTTSTYQDRNDYLSIQKGVDGTRQPSLARLITPPAFAHAPSATPSTRYTDSPFSHVPTPSSASSYSPAMAATFAGSSSFPSSSSPTLIRPHMSGRKNSKENTIRAGLAPVRESSTSSTKSHHRIHEFQGSSTRNEVSSKSTSREATVKSSDNQRSTSRNKLTKGQPGSTGVRRPTQVPPELAHLSVETSSTKSPQKSTPPVRPSRFGTPNLSDMHDQPPVVQSDLPRLYTTYHKRISSQETPVSAGSPSTRSRSGLSPKPGSSNASPRIDSAISPPPSTRKLSRRTTPELQTSNAALMTRKDSPAVSNSSPGKSRFGFFSRKSKPELPKVTEKPKRPPTKGPAAGTGHERYSRFGLRGRTGSLASSTGVRSPSADSSTSSLPLQLSSRKGSTGSRDGSDLDDFLRERLTPVVLRGSGLHTVSSSASSAISSAAASRVSLSREGNPSHQTLSPRAHHLRDISPIKRLSSTRRKPSDSSEDDIRARYPLIVGPPLASLNSREGDSTARLASPHTAGVTPQLAPDEEPDAESSAHSDIDDDPSDDVFALQEGLWFGSGRTDTPTSIERKRNFLQHAQASPRPNCERKVVDVDNVENGHHQTRTTAVAHYALPHPVQPVGLDEVERIMQETETSAEESMNEGGSLPKLVPYEGRHVGLLPAPSQSQHEGTIRVKSKLQPPQITVHRQHTSSSAEVLHIQSPLTRTSTQAPESVKPSPGERSSQPGERSALRSAADLKPAVTPELLQGSFAASGQGSNDNSPRQPRLSPVGRIPRVVSKRDRDRKLPDNSFSRPFVRAQPRPSVKPPGSVYSQIREMASPIEPASQSTPTVGARLEMSAADPTSTLHARGASSLNRISTDASINNEFFSFPPRKDSGQSYSSSSGYPSWTASLSIPQPNHEDVWNEYNDFMDELMPFRNPMTASALGIGMSIPYEQTSRNPFVRSSRIPSMVGAPPSAELPLPPGVSSISTALSLGQQVAKFLQPSLSPLRSQRSSAASELFDDPRTAAAVHDRIGVAKSQRSNNLRLSLSSANGSISSSRYSRSSVHSRSTSLPEATARHSQLSFTTGARVDRDGHLRDIAEVDHTHLSSPIDLRAPALMTSKWLSFGRILFSPAHNEMSLAEEPRVLIVDGLSSDWSYFVALSYPSATVYNLSAETTNLPWPDTKQPPPPNHRQIPLSSLSTSFPFPKGFFNAVVFRFPRATTEQAFQSLIFECKRVLRPGGFLEVAVLDLDLMNMGPEARRAVRNLKTRMQQRDKYVCLRNLSDDLVRHIGRRGFEGVQRCIVGVPAAGRIPRSPDSSSMSTDSGNNPSAWPAEDHGSDRQDFNFADLLDKTRNSQIGSDRGNDESITRMVAKVGRWWYSSCYESSLLSTHRSIWSDRTLLRECEKQGTSFRLLICHAQKPAQPRRRTVSV